MNSLYKYPLMLCLTIIILVVGTAFGIIHYIMVASFTWSLFQKIRKKKWKQARHYTIFIMLLCTFIYFGINTLWLLAGLLLFLLIKTKLLGVIIKHPVLTYEYIYRQMEIAWSQLIIKSTPYDQSFEFVHRMNKESRERIKEIEQRGIKIEFLQKYYENL